MKFLNSGAYRRDVCCCGNMSLNTGLYIIAITEMILLSLLSMQAAFMWVNDGEEVSTSYFVNYGNVISGSIVGLIFIYCCFIGLMIMGVRIKDERYISNM